MNDFFKLKILKANCFGHYNILILVIVSNFVLRISNFMIEKDTFR